MGKFRSVFLIFLLVIPTLGLLISINPQYTSRNIKKISNVVSFSGNTNYKNEPQFRASQGDWANTNFEFRKAITITERAGISLPPESFPVEVFVTFDPPAYFDSQTYHSIRLYDGYTEVPIQIYNYTWSDYGQRLIRSATIAFYATLSASQSKTYYIYWSDRPTEQVNYEPAVSYSTTSTGYVFTTDMYTIETHNSFGGKIYRIIVNGIDIIHGSEDEYIDKSAHFSPIFNPVYSAASIGNAQDLALNGHYMGGISDNADHDQPQITVAGPVFIEYKVTNIAIKQGSTTVAYADVTYRFYKYFFIVKEEIHFPGSVSGEFWIGGWHVDQDDSSSDGQFNMVYMDASSSNGYSYPRTLSDIERYDDADKSSSNSIWTKFYVFNTTKYFGLGYYYLDYNAYQITINQYDSYWINEGSSDDWKVPQSASGSRSSDGSGGWSFYAIAGRRVYVSFHFHIDDTLGFWDDADISIVVRDPNGQTVDSYYSGEPAPSDYTWTTTFTASVTGWYSVTFDYDSAEDWGTNDDDMSWDSYMLYLTSSGYGIYDDYLLWGNRVSLSSSAGGWIYLKYAMIPWSDYDASWYNDLTTELSNPPSKSVSSVIEQYYSIVTIRVIDKDLEPIYNASVLLDGSSADYSGYTNSTGYVTFRVIRDYYSVTVSFTSYNFTYNNYTSLSISYDYSEDKYVSYTFVMDVVKLNIKFVAADNVTTIQGAKLILSHSTYGKVNITSDLEGRASLYLRPAVWWVGALQYAYPGVLNDSFTIKNALTGDPIVENVTEANIDIGVYHSWILIDHMAKEVKPTSKFEMYYGSPAQSVQWGSMLVWYIKWVDQFGNPMDLSSGNDTTDYLAWTVFNASSDEPVIVNGHVMRYYFVPSNVSTILYYKDGEPTYKIALNTSLLSADEAYYIEVEGYMSIRQKPSPMYLFFDVNSIPTVNTLDVNTQVYWNETLKVKFYIWDSEGNPLSGAYVKLKLSDDYGTAVNSSVIPETSPGVYEITIKCDFAPGHYYLSIEYSKPNYAPGYVPMKDIFVLNRPTRLSIYSVKPAPIEYSGDYVKVYWGNYLMKVSFEYVDLLSLQSIEESTRDAKIYKVTPQGNTLMMSLDLRYNATTSTYDAYLNISNMDVGTYILTVEFSKDNYDSQSSKMTITVEERPINIVLSSDYLVSYYGEPVVARFYAEDVLSGDVVRISKNDVMVRVRELSTNNAVNATLIIYSNGTGVIYYSGDLKPSKYVTRVIISKRNYQEETKEFYLEIKERPTYVTMSKKSVQVIWGDEVNLYFWYVDMLNGSALYADNYTVRIIGKANMILPINVRLQVALYQGSIAYLLRFNSSLLDADETYDIYVYFDRAYYEEKSAVVKLYVKPIQLRIYYNEEVSVLKNPLDSSGKLTYSFELRDISEGHENRTFIADSARYELISGYKILMAGQISPNDDGKYVLTIDVKNLDVGSYRLRITIRVSNATITNAKGGVISVLVKIDYFGGSVELFGKKWPVLIVVPTIIGIFLTLGVGIYYAWVYIHIPWEVKYINKLIKLIEEGQKTFEPVDRLEDIDRVAFDLME